MGVLSGLVGFFGAVAAVIGWEGLVLVLLLAALILFTRGARRSRRKPPQPADVQRDGWWFTG
jgi:hypothetical protein